MKLSNTEYADPDARRLAKRWHRHQDQLFTFLDRPEASWENNRAEREIRMLKEQPRNPTGKIMRRSLGVETASDS